MHFSTNIFKIFLPHKLGFSYALASPLFACCSVLGLIDDSKGAWKKDKLLLFLCCW